MILFIASRMTRVMMWAKMTMMVAGKYLPCARGDGYPRCGPNSLYGWEEPGLESLVGRQRSPLFKYYEAMPTVNYPTVGK